MRIANNTSALSAFNILTKSNAAFNKTLQQLSSGLRINSAADDAAGLAISEKMRSQIAGLDVAVRNTQDGISLLQTAEGGLEAATSILQRMRELSVQAANDVLTQQDRGYIQTEIDQLRQEVDRVAKTTQFNKKKLLDGSSGALWSSSDSSVKAKIHGGLMGIDQFGQKVNPEGNYEIEIRAEAGKAQVQKSNVFEITTPEEYTSTLTYQEEVTDTPDTPESFEEIAPVNPIRDIPTPEITINIETGQDSNEATSGDGWSFNNGVLTISGDKTYKIVGSGTATTNRIVVSPGVKASVFLENVNIDVKASRYTSPFDIRDASVDVYLEGENTLVSGYDASALQVQNTGMTSGASLTINSASGFKSTAGVLNATAYSGCAAGIGGPCYTSRGSSPTGWCGSVGNITINGGTINSTAQGPGAGIGGGGYYGWATGDVGSYVNVVINGGNVTARAMSTGAGIGSGGVAKIDPYGVSSITITGGTVAAYASDMLGGAAIGGGYLGNMGDIQISGSVLETMVLEGWIDTENGATLPIGRGRDGLFTKISDYDLGETPEPEPEPEPSYQDREIELTDIAVKPAGISDITAFRDSNGVSLFNDPQKITISQGNGKTAEITLYANDTIYEAAEKINDAIAVSLGQGKYTDDAKHFCTISTGINGTSESVGSSYPVYYESTNPVYDEDGNITYDDDGNIIYEGTKFAGNMMKATMLIRSVVPGKDGELTFSGDEDLLNALGLNEIQSSTESTFHISVKNAHTGQTLTNDEKITGNIAYGLIDENVDIEFDAMSGISASWNDSSKRYDLTNSGSYNAVLHLADNTLMLQTGANEGEDFIVRIGDMSADSLGINRVNVMSHDRAARSITIIDEALDKVLTQRARIGSSQNSLEYTMNSLIVAHENLTAAESQIRNTDMAKVMMAFTKINITRQANISMLAQANQLPQNVLSLIR